MEYRIGQGIDIHPFKENRKLILGGVEIPYEKGLQGHSDADALIHAVVDALLGAIGHGDIGEIFPDTDSKWKDADSKIFLLEALTILTNKGWEIVNIDCTILLEAPKIKPHRDAIKQSLASVLKITPDRISVKATTSERLGYVGRKEGIWVSCCCLIKKI